MNRFLAVLRWRHLRWVACAAIVPALWACNARKLAEPNGAPSQVLKNRFQQAVNRDLDLLFLIDDSTSMAPLQAKMRARLPDFMNVLSRLPGGYPNMHVAVVSSSLGAGAFGNVSGCAPGSAGNLNGSFQHSAACPALNTGSTFISNTPTNNFTGDIVDVFSCIADIGQGGCGFEHQFEATRLALQRAQNPADPDNAGFLRPNAYLAVVMLTNEDDCSVSDSSTLFDPGQQTLADPLGGLQSYRCNEFGHLCNGVKPPHVPPAVMETLDNCVSAEDNQLVTVQGFVDFLKSLKPTNPDQILVAAIAGPVAPYTVIPHTFMLGNGGTEVQPQMAHSCMQAAGEYADPGVRIKQWLDGFGTNGVLESICAADFSGAMMRIAEVIGRAIGPQCVTTNIATNGNGEPDCDVTQRTFTAGTPPVPRDVPVPLCDGARSVIPCWEFGMSNLCTNNTQVLNVCYDAGCTEAAKPKDRTDALISCAVIP